MVYSVYSRAKASRRLTRLAKYRTLTEARDEVRKLRAASKARNDNTHTYSVVKSYE